jgi:transcriptional regulator with XRE-family HTH domain
MILIQFLPGILDPLHHLNIVVAGETPTTPIRSANFLYDKPFVVLNFSNCIHCHYGNETLLAIDYYRSCSHITRVVNHLDRFSKFIDRSVLLCFIAIMVNVIDIKNLKINEVDMFLKQKMQEVGMDSQELARRLNVSPVTTYRWEKGDRKISPQQAILIADILKCEPEDILFPAKKIDLIELHSYAEDYVVKSLDKKNYRNIIIPGGFYTPSTKAVQFWIPGGEMHNEIHLFERNHHCSDYFGFSEDAINKTCYIEPIDKVKKKGFRDVIGILERDRTKKRFKINILHPETKKPFTHGASVDPKDIKIAAPRKMTYFESFNKYRQNKKSF